MKGKSRRKVKNHIPEHVMCWMMRSSLSFGAACLVSFAQWRAFCHLVASFFSASEKKLRAASLIVVSGSHVCWLSVQTRAAAATTPACVRGAMPVLPGALAVPRSHGDITGSWAFCRSLHHGKAGLESPFFHSLVPLTAAAGSNIRGRVFGSPVIPGKKSVFPAGC